MAEAGRKANFWYPTRRIITFTSMNPSLPATTTTTLSLCEKGLGLVVSRGVFFGYWGKGNTRLLKSCDRVGLRSEHRYGRDIVVVVVVDGG